MNVQQNGKIIAVLLAVVTTLSACAMMNPSKYDDFAQCLTEEDVTYYGSFTCPACAQQDQLFRASKEYIDYVECTTPDGQGTTVTCQTEEITSTPTWEFADGTRLEGVQSLETLADMTDCELPE